MPFRVISTSTERRSVSWPSLPFLAPPVPLQPDLLEEDPYRPAPGGWLQPRGLPGREGRRSGGDSSGSDSGGSRGSGRFRRSCLACGLRLQVPAAAASRPAGAAPQRQDKTWQRRVMQQTGQAHSCAGSTSVAKAVVCLWSSMHLQSFLWLRRRACAWMRQLRLQQWQRCTRDTTI